MNCLPVFVVLLVLIAGGHSLECKVCKEGIQKMRSNVRADMDLTQYYFDEGCKDTEADNMAACSGEEDVCVKYKSYYETQARGAVQMETYEHYITQYRCGVQAEVDSAEVPFCRGFVDSQPTHHKQVKCDVAEISGKDAEEKDKDCRTEMCSAGQVPQLFLGAASIVIYLLF